MEFKCPSCGGSLTFDSQSQKLKCNYCKTEFDQKVLDEYAEALKDMPEDSCNWQVNTGDNWEQQEAEHLSIYVCESCGGEIVGDQTTLATACPYCGNPVVLLGRLAGDLKPAYIIPFKLGKQEAEAALAQYCRGKKLLPKAFSSENQIKKIKGLYVPFWVFDAKAQANAEYRATRVMSWSDSNYIYTKTSYYSVFRQGSLQFAKLPVDASSKMPDDLMQSLEPYDISQAVDFNVAYLAGYLADRYDETSDKCQEVANQRIKNSLEATLRETVQGYMTVFPQGSSIQLQENTAHYVLYPVWILNTNYREQEYTFAMNGQTGHFVGRLPVDKKAAWTWFIILALLFTLVIMGGSSIVRYFFA